METENRYPVKHRALKFLQGSVQVRLIGKAP